jgi:hypothetical protein
VLAFLIILSIVAIVPLFYFKLKVNLIEIFTYFPLAFVVENELLNVFSLNLKVFKGKSPVGDWIIIVFLMVIVPVTILWTIHLVRSSNHWLMKFFVFLLITGMLILIELYTFHTSPIKTKNWSYIYPIFHLLAVFIFLLTFSTFFRKKLIREGIRS